MKPQAVLNQSLKRAPGPPIKHRERLDGHHKNTYALYTVTRLLNEYRDPRAILLEIASTDTQTLAQTLDCSLLEALGERRLCAQQVLPYVAQKLPVQVDMRHTKAIHLNIVDERQYQELVEVSESPLDSDDGMSIQLMSTNTAEHSTASSTSMTGDEGDETGVQPSVPASPKATGQGSL